MTLHLLGTGAAISDPHRTTTMLAVESETSLIVIDCGGDAVQRLMAAGIDMAKLSALVITHEHPDHVSGFPLFMEKIWLAGRRELLPVYGIAPALAQARRIHDSFNTEDWSGYPAIDWREFELEPNVPVLDDETWTVMASPGKHSVPVCGLRIVHKETAKVLAYSCDTEFSETLINLAQNADVFVHEATGDFPGHATALEAARAAQQANAKRLLLVHLPPESDLTETHMNEARKMFANAEKGLELGSYLL